MNRRATLNYCQKRGIKKMRSFSIYIVVIFLALSGCASVSELKQELASTPTALTTSFSDMKVLPIEEGKELSIQLSKGSPVFIFEEGKSYYTTIAIPESKSARKLNIKSFFSTSYLPEANIFYPYFVFLNESKQPIKSEKNISLRSGSDFWLGGFYEGSVVVPVEAKEIIIYTSDNQSPTLLSFAENGTVRSVPHAPSGNIKLSLSAPYPPNYDFSTAIIKDTVQSKDSNKCDFFYVSHIDGKQIEESRTKTLNLNRGRGLHMTPYLVEREVSVNAATYTIVGRTEYAAPILAMINPVYEIRGQIKVALEKDKDYEVHGELGENYSAVWLEDTAEHKIIGKKFERHGSAKEDIPSE